MEYSREALRESLRALDLPPEDARGFVDPRVLAELERRFSDEQLERLSVTLERDVVDYRDLITTSMLATYAIAGELSRGIFEVDSSFLGGRPIRIPLARMDWWLMRRATAGLLERGVDPEGRRFGVTVDLPGFYPPIAPTTLTLRLPRLGRDLPLLVTRARLDLHGCVHPANATTSCYAQRDGTVGVVTAGHAVEGLTSRARVPLDSGRSGALIRSGYRPIDAAFIAVPDPPPALEPLPLVRFPTAGDELLVGTRQSAVPRTVVDVGLTQLDPRFRDYPLNFLIDRPFEQGDSGSLVTLLSGEAIGIYVGAQWRVLPNGSAQHAANGRMLAGLVQNLAQAVYTLGVHPLKEPGG